MIQIRAVPVLWSVYATVPAWKLMGVRYQPGYGLRLVWTVVEEPGTFFIRIPGFPLKVVAHPSLRSALEAAAAATPLIKQPKERTPMNYIVCVTTGAATCERSLEDLIQQNLPVRVLLIDNATPPDRARVIGEWVAATEARAKAVEIIRFETRQSLASAWNFGIRRAMAASDCAWVVNDDIRVTPDTLRQLLATGEPFVTPVNARDAVDDSIKTAAQQATSELVTTIQQALAALPVDLENRSPHPDFSCFLIHKSVWKQVGEFDTSFQGAYAEDCDYHCRMHAAGITAWSVQVPYYHVGSASLLTLSATKRKQVEEQANRNREYFERKWGFSIESDAYPAFFEKSAAKLEPRKPRLLWVGDILCPTGFARVAESILPTLRDLGWDIYVLGINYKGDPHTLPYHIYPAARFGDYDMWGFNRFLPLLKEVRPDATLINNDVWIADPFSQNSGGIPTYAYMPVDAVNLRRSWVERLNSLSRAVFYTKFGETQARAAGLKSTSVVIPHGIDTSMFTPVDRDECRRRLGLADLGDAAFIVGCVATNSFRKRLDLTLQYFYRWVAKYEIENAYLYIHAKTKGLWDVKQLAEYYEQTLGLPPGRLITLSDGLMAAGGVAASKLKYVYGAMDVQVSTCGGEGWGLTHMEGMACGVRQLLPNFGSLAEWATGAAVMVDVGPSAAYEYNTIGYFPKEAEFIEQLQAIYEDTDDRKGLRSRGLALVRRPQYQWPNIAKRFHAILTA